MLKCLVLSCLYVDYAFGVLHVVVEVTLNLRAGWQSEAGNTKEKGKALGNLSLHSSLTPFELFSHKAPPTPMSWGSSELKVNSKFTLNVKFSLLAFGLSPGTFSSDRVLPRTYRFSEWGAMASLFWSSV